MEKLRYCDLLIQGLLDVLEYVFKVYSLIHYQ